MKKPENVHITQTMLHDFSNGVLNRYEMTAAMEHMAVCERCALAFAEAIETKQAVLVPAGFDEEVLNKTVRLNKDKKELLHYSFRVALAACGALCLFFSGALNTLAKPRNAIEMIESPDFSMAENINTHLRHFSQQILNMEVFKNDKKAK
ncbi:MAG: hypothetical protein WDA65_00980 [Christensenellales bacterium]